MSGAEMGVLVELLNTHVLTTDEIAVIRLQEKHPAWRIYRNPITKVVLAERSDPPWYSERHTDAVQLDRVLTDYYDKLTPEMLPKRLDDISPLKERAATPKGAPRPPGDG